MLVLALFSKLLSLLDLFSFAAGLCAASMHQRRSNLRGPKSGQGAAALRACSAPGCHADPHRCLHFIGSIDASLFYLLQPCPAQEVLVPFLPTWSRPGLRHSGHLWLSGG